MSSWADISICDSNNHEELIKNMSRIMEYEIHYIKEAISIYIEKSSESISGYSTNMMAKLHVLNRYIFNVPECIDVNTPRYGSFIGIPIENQDVNALWPLRTNDAGDLELYDDFKGYIGESFMAIEEFDYFLKEYGIREFK
ncbi:MAG: hypothetical protein HRT68_05130 [Flavobacteriaceae bacterium]|nr:hypothetical protein [Flavobacteriaceae bacterium]